MDEETSTLINLWGEMNIEDQLDDPKKRKGDIYKELSVELNLYGHERTSEQCKMRMHTLKRAYRQCKSNMKTSGKGRKLCKFYKELDGILGCRPASSPVKVIESMSMRKRKNRNSDEDQESDADSNLSGFEELESDVERSAEDSDNENQASVNDEPAGTLIEDKSGATPNQDPTKAEKNDKSRMKKEDKGKKTIKRQRKTRLEAALGTVMNSFAESNKKLDKQHLEVEKMKTNFEMKKLDVEKQRIETEERQKREDREHQFKMMQLILGRVNGPQQAMASGMHASQNPWQYNGGQVHPPLQGNPDISFDGSGNSYSNL